MTASWTRQQARSSARSSPSSAELPIGAGAPAFATGHYVLVFVTTLKALGALCLASLIVWLMWIQQRYSMLRRLGIAIIAIVLLIPTFALTVSVRCDLGQLPEDECYLSAP